MRLFDEEVHVTLTNSNCNYITVESYEEIFFDVYEIEFGGKKYITEKVGTHNGYPVVSIPVSENNRTVEVEFVLKEGRTPEVLFNKSLAVVQKESLANYDIDDSIIVESVEEESSVDEIETVLREHEQSDKIREGILRAKESGAKFVATAYADRIIKEKMNNLESSIDLKYANLQEYVDNAKAVLFEDFVKLVDVARESITSSNQRDKEGIESSVKTQLSECILALESSLSEKQEEAVAKFDEKLTGIANEVLNTVLLPEVANRETKIKESLIVDVDQRLKNLHESLDAELVSAKSGITTLEKINVEITDSLKKSSSKIDLVEKSLHTKLKEASKKIQSLVESETVKVTEYYNHKIELIENDISSKLTSTDKEEIIALVESSKQSIISELASTQRDIPNIIIEKANGSKEINVNKLKSEVEKSISTSVTNKFSTEIQALKRLVEMSSGGGSVAMQFAAGGTMNGNLTVVGAVSASQYLGLPIPRSDYLPLSGGTITGDVTVTGGLSADRIYTTQLDALSANITVIDIKQYELSGFNVTGNVTINGTVSAGNLSAGDITAENARFTGNLTVDTNTLFVDSVNNRVGIGTTTPNERLTVSGNLSASGDITASNLVYTTSDQTIAGLKTFSDNIVGNGTANRLPNQLAVASSDIITKGLADSRYTSRNERITDDTTFLQTTWEQFLDFDDQYNADLTLAAASGSTTFGASPAVFGDVWTTSNAGVTAFNGNDAHTHRGIFLVRGPTASSQSFYIGINRTTVPYNLTNRVEEFTCRVFVGSTDFRTQGYFKIGLIPKGGTGGADTSLRGGLIFNPYFHATNLVLGVNKSATVSPFTFTTNPLSADFLDTGVNFINLLDRWVNITYKIDRSGASPIITIIIVRENVVLFQASYNISTDPVVSTWARKADLYVNGASNEIGIQNGKFTYTTRSQLHIDYLYYKVTGTSAAPSNWNSLRF